MKDKELINDIFEYIEMWEEGRYIIISKQDFDKMKNLWLGK